MVRDIYLADDLKFVEKLVDRAINACISDLVPEIRKLGKMLTKWVTEILNHHKTGVSNGPTEGLNLLIKKIKRVGHRFRNFGNYRLGILLYVGGCDWSKLAIPAIPIRNRKTLLK